MQATSNREDYIRPFCQPIATVRASHPDRPDVQRMIGQEIGTTRNGFYHRNAARAGKLRQLLHGLGILHAATGNDRRALGSFQCGDGLLKFARIRHLLANAVNFGFKK